MSVETTTDPPAQPEHSNVGDPDRGVAAASVLGRAVGTALSVVSAVRPAAKPLHPVGSVSAGVLRREGSDPRSGVAWIDDPGEDEVLLRLSRSVGVPAPAPDFFGLALRVPVAGDGTAAYGDFLFSGTGTGRLLRFVFLPTFSPTGRAMGTVLPYLSPGGPLLLLADPAGESAFDLRWAVGRGPWTRFATLEMGGEARLSDDEPISFDAVRNTLPGLTPYPWVRRLREPSYRRARRHRGLPD